MVTIYHNPRCSKSRQTLQLLRDQGIEPEIVEYLKTPLTAEQLTALLTLLGMEVRNLLRTSEADYKENNLANPELSAEQLIEAMVKMPKLMQRPIVVNGEKAAIGRPPEQVLDII